jgi:putative colanic acid biosynthesis glycosyltransferase
MNLSIITVHLDDFSGLRRTLASLQGHISLADVEWVVVDGGSRPGSETDTGFLAKVRANASRLVSESDQGIYDAMNKGTRLAQGKYVLFLNAGDELHPDFKFRSWAQFFRKEQADMLWGGCTERYCNGEEINVKTRSPRWTWYGMPAYHPAIFFRRKILGEKPYDTTFRIAADYDLISRLVSSGCVVERVPLKVSVFNRGGLSDTRSDEMRQEENRARLKHFLVPRWVGASIVAFKSVNSRIAKVAWFRRLWRSKI